MVSVPYFIQTRLQETKNCIQLSIKKVGEIQFQFDLNVTQGVPQRIYFGWLEILIKQLYKFFWCSSIGKYDLNYDEQLWDTL